MAAAVLVAIPAQAIPLANSFGALKSAVEESSMIEHADACNRVCRKGPVEEWGNAVRWGRWWEVCATHR